MKAQQMKNDTKDKIESEAKVSIKVEKLLTDFETAEATFRFADISSKRSKYNRDIDEAFYNHAKSYIEKLCKLLVLVNAGEMYHLHQYRQALIKHKKDINNVYEKINDIKL
tara:strand:+ start:399 stop:731 length:333 start_codon:yes stop_codon:yes gene_type:complete